MALKSGERHWEWVYKEASGLRIYARAGKGHPAEAPVVILVPGLVVASGYMVPTLERLCKDFRVFAIDLPGYGRSSGLRHALDTDELADSLAGWMDAMEIAEANLVGNSYGCNIIAEFAVRHPHRLKKAVLQGPVVEEKARRMWPQFRRLARNSPLEPHSLGLIMARDYAKAGFRVARETIAHSLSHPIEERLPDVQAPTLVLRGSRDTIAPQEWAERVTALLPHGDLRVIPGAAHTINYAAPLEFARVVKPFLIH
jgi:2-hydroxy-6-oxonona-2,4-dienedioate hydrolase